ncbi:hypothetical protein BS297_27420 [Rhodococcus erythropolis]|uniref:Transcriptional regulator LmrA/YxaF-like C-terminal domain-containing protein n=1 Tax=Rhodococcus erythropolis TaxID=1833 RepID=A0A0C3ADV8_RHOER|nr:hypothetical protein BS297_27420 [Rhodococcus erythropolis]KIM17501.1 hypothetical protein QV65_04470 [Rhodococcus erythropolis]
MVAGATQMLAQSGLQAASVSEILDKLAGLFEESGVEVASTQRFATTLIVASEGAVVLSRTKRSMEPFELVAAQILDETRRLTVTAKRNCRGGRSPSNGSRSVLHQTTFRSGRSLSPR